MTRSHDIEAFAGKILNFPLIHPTLRIYSTGSSGVTGEESDLKLLQLPYVALTLADHLSHLVLVFVLLMQPLGLLPLVLLLRKLKEGQKKLTDTTVDGSQVVRRLVGWRIHATCLIFSLSSEELPVELMRRLFLNMAIRVLASLRWIFGIRFFSCCCRAFRFSIILWL